MHIFLQGCVYIKLDSISTALSVYKALHGSWFNGKWIRISNYVRSALLLYVKKSNAVQCRAVVAQIVLTLRFVMSVVSE